MSDKSAYESHAVRIWYQDGQRFTERRRLQIPWWMALRKFDRLSDLQIREALNDILAETQRREARA